jgi:hypothetical protein
LPERISEALKWCDTLLLLWSKSAAVSRWVQLEWTNAFALKRSIIPCVFDNTPLPAILASSTFVDFSNFESGYRILAQALRLLGKGEEPKEIPQVVTPDPRITDATIKARTKIFVSYAHRNTNWLERLRVHLKPLELNHNIEIWDDRKIRAGSKWRKEIESAIQPARVAIVLISADFLASDFILKNELPPLLAKANDGGAIILPIILSPCRFLRLRIYHNFKL